MKKDCAQTNDDRLSVDGWRLDYTRRVCEDDAIIAFIDLLGTKSLYEGPLPSRDQAEKIFSSLINKFDIKFGEHFNSKAIQQSFDISIFADSIVVSVRMSIPKSIERLVEFLLEYQEDLLVNDLFLPSRAVLTRDSFFSFKISKASEESILGSPNTSISLCGGKGIKSAHDCFKGLPIGVYVTRRAEPELTAEQQKRIVSVRHTDKYPDLSFIKMRRDIKDYLPPETLVLLSEKPEANQEEIIDSIKRALGSQDAAKGTTWYTSLLQRWEFLTSGVQDEDIFRAKWTPWLLAHLGKQDEIVRL